MSKAPKKKAEEATITIRQVKSEIGTNRRHREVLRGLGLRGIQHSVVRQDSGAVRGMIAKVPHLVAVEEAR